MSTKTETRSHTQTEPAPAPTQPQSGKEKLGPEKLPPPAQTWTDDDGVQVDVLASIDQPAAVFNRPYKNADDLVDHYRELLASILRCGEDEDNRNDAYTILRQAIFAQQDKCNYQAVRDQLFEWARGGYKDEPPKTYFDSDNKQRSRLVEEDPNFLNRKTVDEDVPMQEDDIELPADMSFYENQWSEATQSLKWLLDFPQNCWLDDQKHVRTVLKKLNSDIRAKENADKYTGPSLQVPLQDILGALVQGVMALVKEQPTMCEGYLNLLAQKIDRVGQPKQWHKMVEQAIEKKQKRVKMADAAKDPLRYGLWQDDFWATLEKQFATNASTDPGNDENGTIPNTGDASSEPDPPKPSPTSGQSTPKDDGFKNHPGGGFRYVPKPNFVRYEGKERKIGGLRYVGKTIRGVQVHLWQVLVEVSAPSSSFRVWHIVGSRKLGANVAERYMEKGDNYITRDHKGTPHECAGRNLEDFVWKGVAYIPQASDQRAPVQLVLGCFTDGEDKFWDRSLLGRVFSRPSVDEYLAYGLRDANCKRIPGPRRPRKNQWGFREDSDSGHSVGEEDDSDSEGELDANDGKYEDEGDDFVEADEENPKVSKMSAKQKREMMEGLLNDPDFGAEFRANLRDDSMPRKGKKHTAKARSKR